MSDARIQPVGAHVSAQLCTAQVVVSLANAVKELVENALDAQANIVEIKLKNFGLEQVEVSDNGYGIGQQDLPLLGKPHHTSKLQSFTGLSAVDSFGFRGEALNALCALANVQLITRTAHDQLGTMCTFDAAGNITQRVNVARQVGTTVRVHDIFCRLPVRRKELERNARREFNKVLQTVQSFALCALNVRVSCSHIGNELVATPTQLVVSDSAGEQCMA